MAIAISLVATKKSQEKEVGLQMGRLLVGTILDPDPFLNNRLGSNFDSEPVLLVPNPDSVPELSPPRGLASSSKSGSNLSRFF